LVQIRLKSCGIKKTIIMSKFYHKKHFRKGPATLPPGAGKTKKEKSKENIYWMYFLVFLGLSLVLLYFFR
jgi:hypothetical protein